jgi:hypothetical protein
VEDNLMLRLIDAVRNSNNRETKIDVLREHYNFRFKTTTSKLEATAILNMSSVMNMHIGGDEIERGAD